MLQDDVVVISDSESEGGRRDNSSSAARKRKLGPETSVKLEWTDDSDENAYGTLKNRKGTAKRRSAGSAATGPNKKPGRGNGASRKSTAPNARRSSGHKGKRWSTDGAGETDEEEDDVQVMPDYLRQRRREFDRKRELLREEGGLMLPPDYSDIYFSDEERGLGALAERPDFSSSASVKPCRPYADIPLPDSGGLIPASVAQYLRDYQVDGVRFLHHLFVFQRGGILGDDMGLGKTVQVAAFLCAAFGKTGDERDAKRMRKMRRHHDGTDGGGGRWYPRVLVVCPGSLIRNWCNELERWGYWHVDVYHGAGRDDVLAAARRGRLEIMITTYGTYKNSKSAVNDVEWDAVVADECHVLRERSSEVTRAMNEVNALCRIGLTGTAIQNRYEELWTLLNWTNPGRFGTIAEWTATICRPLTVGQSHDATLAQLSLARKTARKLVQNLLPQFFLRRMKSLIADQLPKKSDRVVFCPLTSVQKEAYQNFLAGWQASTLRDVHNVCNCGSGNKKGWCCYKLLPNGNPWQTIVFPTIVALQKMSSHLALLIPSSSEPDAKKESELAILQSALPDWWEEAYRNRDALVNLANPDFCGKWRVLKKLLRFWHGAGDKVLVFSHSVRLLRILQHLFHNTSYSVSYLDGSLSYEDRQRAVDDFNSDPAQFVFLISTRAGGVGLNITSANKVVIVDPHWNPAYDLQAQDRAYRIGQTRDVDVFRLVCAGTIEEIVYARQVYKQQQANIGYRASEERRYFRGVQRDRDRKGEIFGLDNMLRFHGDEALLRNIVNKTNIAEARAGEDLMLADLDMDAAARDPDLPFIKREPGLDDNDGGVAEDGGLSQLADFLKRDLKQDPDDDDATSRDRTTGKEEPKRKTDAIQAILASAGVEYTHENSEVIGTSRIEVQLSRRAEQLVVDPDEAGVAGTAAVHANHRPFQDNDDTVGSSAMPTPNELMLAAAVSQPLFSDRRATSWSTSIGGIRSRHHIEYRYRPPEDVRLRQFCSMARAFGFSGATANQDFALVVEGWTQEQRRRALELFYRSREPLVAALEEAGRETEDEGDDREDAREGQGEERERAKREDEGEESERVKREDEGEESEHVKREVKDEDDSKVKIKIEVEDDQNGMHDVATRNEGEASGVKVDTDAEVKVEVKREGWSGVYCDDGYETEEL